MLLKAFTAYMKVLSKCLRFYDTYSRASKNFLSEVEILSNARLTHHIIDPVTLQRYLRPIPYALHKMSPHYEYVFRHTYSFYAEQLVLFTNSTDQLLVHIPFLLKTCLPETDVTLQHMHISLKSRSRHE